MLQMVCVLAGCDFLPSVKGIAAKRAHALVKKYRSSFQRLLAVLKADPKLSMPAGYPQAAQQALYSFQHPLVFDPAATGTTDLACLCACVFTPLEILCAVTQGGTDHLESC